MSKLTMEWWQYLMALSISAITALVLESFIGRS
jgi:hypothetical protein